MRNIFIMVVIMTFLQGFGFSGLKTKTETVKIKCEKMHCMGCKASITEAVESLDGVKKIEVDLKTKIISVSFDNNKTNAVKISEKILDAGYENEIIE